uniref:Maturase K n=1 Tax=Panagrolaimus davidi TaxID=227884 RepID=A0A914QU60_9BILA
MYPLYPKGYQKLVKTCKYFFAKNPVFAIEELTFSFNQKPICFLNNIKKSINFDNLTSKLWVYEAISASFYKTPNIFSSYISHFYRNDVKNLHLFYQNLSYNEFLFLASNVEDIGLLEIIVKNENDEIVPLEKLIKALQKIKRIHFRNNLDSSSITTNTVKELVEIPHFSKIEKFKLFKLSELFDIETFFTYLKKNKQTIFCLFFGDSVSDAYKSRLESIIDKIIATEEHDYKPPLIQFSGIPFEKCYSIYSLYSGK